MPPQKKKLSDPLRPDKIEELYNIWKNPMELSAIEERIVKGEYSPMDMFIFKAYSGEISFLRALFQKVYPDQSSVEVEHKSKTMSDLLDELEKSRIGSPVDGNIIDAEVLSDPLQIK